MAETILTKRDGVVSMDKTFDYLCSLLRNGVYTVKIVRKTEPRTISQNASDDVCDDVWAFRLWAAVR